MMSCPTLARVSTVGEAISVLLGSLPRCPTHFPSSQLLLTLYPSLRELPLNGGHPYLLDESQNVHFLKRKNSVAQTVYRESHRSWQVRDRFCRLESQIDWGIMRILIGGLVGVITG